MRILKGLASAAILLGVVNFLSVTGAAQAPTPPTACAGAPATMKIYRRLAEITSIAEPLIGVAEVSLSQARKIAHFRMTYDGCGDLVDIQYFHGDTPKPIDENFAGNSFVPASRLTFERDDSRTRIRFFDNAGAPKTVFDTVQSVDLRRDRKGKLVRADFLGADDSPVDSALGYASVTWRWRDDANAVETRYDSAGTITQGRGELPFREAHIAFDAAGFAASISPAALNYRMDISRNHEFARQWRQILDDDGEPARGGAADVSRIEYAYDENGYLVRAKYLDEKGAPLLATSGHMGFQRDYDEAGNRLSYHFLDANDEIWTPPARGYAGQTFQWREDGVVRIRTNYLDAGGAVIDHPERGYASIVYEFDDNNIVARRIFLNADGQAADK